MRSLSKVLALGGAVVLLTGCAGTMRSYDAELKQTVNHVATGNVAGALAELEKNNTGGAAGLGLGNSDKDLLYYLEKGELLRLGGQYEQSAAAWLSADQRVKEWEEIAKHSPGKLLGDLGSVIINDKARRYDGQDYEKVLLSTRLALNHIAMGKWGEARTEIKKTHEREAIIAELRSKEVEQATEEAKTRNVHTRYKDLQGYPVESLDDPEVTALKNGYQSAFSHYLAGFVYEALGEPSLAAPGYRKAIELRPNVRFLEEGLAGLDKRAHVGKRGHTDVLFVVESGSAPARQSVMIPLPVPYMAGGRGTVGVIPTSFPVIKSERAFMPSSITLDGKANLPLAPVTNVDAMARRALKDEMPGIILRTTVRAIAKSIAQKQAADRGGALAGLLVTIAAVATESADERVWRTLPAQISLGRALLPSGKHSMKLSGQAGEQQLEFEAQGKYTVIPVRLMGSHLYAMRPQSSVEMAAQATVEPPAKALPEAAAPVEEAPKPGARPVKSKKVRKGAIS
ncbi:MAG: hypothetical protein HY850_11070 [Betaproteobacteria bacterium]|nr:hypothetical protein [Betaproteobacteria bacterium]